MQRIVPHLWFDKEAKQAAELYTSLIPESNITGTTTLHNTPSGDTDIVTFTLAGQQFIAISGGPLFKFNPSVSFHIKCAAKEEVDALWAKLSDGGQILMPLDAYPFSERYGWLQDQYGVSWQIIYVGNGDMKQRITPVLMFVGSVCGKTEEAVNFYASVFQNSSAQVLSRYGAGEEPDNEGTVRYATYTLDGQEFGAMDSAREHNFAFNEAVSLIVNCNSQDEIDHFWEKLSAAPEAEQCGWLKDKYGVSWQVVPTAMNEMMSQGTPEQIDRVTKAFLPMKKFDLAEIQRAYEGTRT